MQTSYSKRAMSIDTTDMFARTMDTFASLKMTENTSLTEKGDISLSTTCDKLVDAGYRLCRGLLQTQTNQIVVELFDGLSGEAKSKMCEDAFVIWASTRDVRGGKGERDVGNWILISLCEIFPEICMKIVEFIPEYGSWKDVFVLMENEGVSAEMVGRLVDMTRKQLEEDEKAEKPSLCAKWAPREKNSRKDKRMSKKLADELFPDEVVAIHEVLEKTIILRSSLYSIRVHTYYVDGQPSSTKQIT